MAPASSITITRSLEFAVKTSPSETNQVKARSKALRLEKENNHQCQANNIVNVMSAPGVGANYHYYFVDHSQLGSSSGGGSSSSIKSNKNKVCQAILDAPNADGANQAKRSGSGGVDELEHCSGRPRRTHNRRQHHNQEHSLVDEHENNMTRPRESHSLRPDFIAGPSLSLASSFSSSTSTTTTTSSSSATAAATSRKQPKISERKSSTNNIIINNYEHSSRQALVNSNNSNQMKRQQQLESGAGPESKAASLPAARLFSSLPLCLVLFALSLFSSTTTTLVNGIKLQPEGKEKFYWSGEQFVITCQNNNNIKNVKIRWTGPDNSIITENRKERIHVESNGHRLVVNNTQLVHDDGIYACTINEGPRIRESADFTLKVLKETNFKSTAKHVTLKAGSRGQVDCHVDFDQSVTTASVTWFKNQQPVDLLNDSSIRVQEYDPGRQVSSLIFVPVKREHDDEYTCQATAVTPNLSKIIDYKIRVETQFGPTFDSAEEIIWVESIQAINSRLHNSIGGGLGQHTTTGATSSHHQYQHQQQQQQQQSTATIPHRNMFGANNQRNRGGRLRPGSAGQDLGGSEQQTTTTAGGSGPHPVGEQVVRVELKCSCQANPDANILWFASSNQNFAINKGSPEQVVEDPIQVRSGHNVTSTLVVAYNLDPNWERRREKYKCSASNLLATAEKYYTIEQGNPPPAFLVGPHRSYSPETTVLNFTLLGPVGSSSGGTGGGGEPKEAIVGSLASITPPVDSFRIRAESGPAPTGLGATTTLIAGGSGGHQLQHQHQAHLLTDQQAAELRSIGHARRQTDQTVQWAYSLGPDVNLPLNMSVKLGNLPSGVQRLFLEAHNAVGYSPNSTYLGEFNLVSSGFSSAALNNLSGQNLFVLLASQLVLLASYLMIAPHS